MGVDSRRDLRRAWRLIAVDTNIMVYSHRRDSVFHKKAFAVVRGLAESDMPWAIPWPVLHEFLAIVTHPRIYNPPTTIQDALRQIDAWLASPSLALVGETGASYPDLLRETLVVSHAVGPRVHDARVASICRAHGISQLWSADRDFTRFPAIVVVNPLTQATA